jgi:hypothetical protein
VRPGTLTPDYEEYASVESRGAFATEHFFAEGIHYVFQVRPFISPSSASAHLVSSFEGTVS